MERNLPSPDRGDAASGAWVCGEVDPAFGKTYDIQPGVFSSIYDYRETTLEQEVLDDLGAIS